MITIDRIEENIAVCFDEEKQELHIPLEQLPPEIKEGDILTLLADNTYQIDQEATAQRREAIKQRLMELVRKSQNKES